jgi:hypothetical protein
MYGLYVFPQLEGSQVACSKGLAISETVNSRKDVSGSCRSNYRGLLRKVDELWIGKTTETLRAKQRGDHLLQGY